MKHIRKGSVVMLLMFLASGASAQVSKIRINEVMVINTDSYTDSYGRRLPWIELYNTYGATIDIGGCYLSDDRTDLKKYPIPKGDLNTKTGPRQHKVFWTDSPATDGTFHTNFSLYPGIENRIYFSDNSGSLVDSMVIPASLSENRTYGRIEDGRIEVGFLDQVTPAAQNVVKDTAAASNSFKQKDPSGGGMSITAMSVVFVALVLLYLSFKYIGRYFVLRTVKSAYRTKDKPKTREQEEGLSGEVCAAIAYAIYEMQNEQHDRETTILTIEQISKRYSPWSSKIHTLRRIPDIKKSDRI